VLFRAIALRPEDQGIVAEFENLCRAYRDLEALLEFENETPLPDYSEVGQPQHKFEAIRKGELVAAEERRRLGIGDDPIRDIFALLESQGIRLFVWPLPGSGISGLFLYDRSIGPCILINREEHSNRLAFNAAHEYAHVLLDRKLRAGVSPTSQLQSDPDQRGELLEVRANSFAAAFLLPAAGIARFLGDRGKSHRNRHALDIMAILSLHRAFGVSYQAVLYRLQNLGWLDRARREELAAYQPENLARALGLLEEPEADSLAKREHRYPPRYVSLALKAYGQAKISLGKLAELLGKSLADTRELVQTLGLEPEGV